MDSQNWWNVTKRNNKQSDGNREHRFSKASIGQPMSLQNSTSDSFPADNSNCSTMTMKCIILQKNEKGFGLTVSGDNPVYVQSVKEDGAAHKAGVHEGDRIIKVNGTNVTEYGHIEVVKLIKADSYVALTLLGVPGGSGSGQSGDASSNHHHHHHHGSHDHNKNSSNKFSQNPAKAQKDEAIKTIKMMLISSQSEYEKIKEEYAKMPSEKLLQDLRTAQNVKQGLEKKLWRANTSAESSNSSHAPASQPARSSRFITDIDESLGLEESKSELQSKRGISSSAMDLRSPPDPETSSTTGSTSSATNHQQQQQTFANRNTMHDIKLNVNGSSSVNRGSTDNMIQQLQQENDSLSSLRLQQPTMEVVRSPSSSSGGGGSFNVPVQNTDIINFEDDDIVENCSESRIQLCDHGPFNELERLKQRPAHFAVFLNYVLLSHEPQSLLFLIAVDSYKHISSTKDMHKQADAVYKHFLPPTATFKVDVDEAMASSIYNNLKTKNLSEDALRCMFDPAVQTCTREIRDQLGQYRHKREQGLGNMFGDEKLPQGDHTIDPQHEARLVDEIIGTKVHELHQPTSYFQDPSTERLHVVQEILHGFVIMYGTKRKAKFDRVLSILGNKPKGSNLSSRTKMSTSTETINEDSKTSKRFKHFVKTKKDERAKKGSSSSSSTLSSSSKSSSGVTRRPTSEPIHHIKILHNNTTTTTTGHRAKSVHIATTVAMHDRVMSSSGACGGESELVRMIEGGGGSELVSRSLIELERLDSLRADSSPADDTSPSSAIRTSASAEQQQQQTSNHPHHQAAQQQQQLSPQSADITNLGGAGGLMMMRPDSANSSTNMRGSSSNNDLESLTVHDPMTKKPSRSGSFRGGRRNNNEKRYGGSSKSHSDPDKDKVELAVKEHSITTDQLDLQHGGGGREGSGGGSESTREKSKSFNLPQLENDPEIMLAAVEHWHTTVPNSVRKKMSKNELARQEVIHELMYTEQHHIRDLCIMDKLFYESMNASKVLDDDELIHVFTNLKLVLAMHRKLNNALQKIKEKDGHVVKEIGDALLETFEEKGEEFKRESSTFCENQSRSLTFIKNKLRRDARFCEFLSDMQRHSLCRKLHLKDFIPMEFQRLTKYPLLLDNIIKHTKNKDSSEVRKIRKACEKSRAILAHVNLQVKIAEDREQLKEIQQNLDRTPLSKLSSGPDIVQEFKDMDLLEYPAVHQGTLQFCIGLMDRKKEITMHVIVYKHVVVLLEQSNGKYYLKTQSAAGQRGPAMPPFIKMQDLIVRPVATDKLAFFMMASQQGLYQFAAGTTKSKDKWIDILNSAAEEYKKQHPINPKPQPKPKRKVVTPDPIDNIPTELNLSEIDGTYDDGNNDELVTRPVDEQPNVFTPTFVPQLPKWKENEAKKKYKAVHEETRSNFRTMRHLLSEITDCDLVNLDTVLDMSTSDGDADNRTLVLHSLSLVDKLMSVITEATSPSNVCLFPPPPSSSSSQPRISSADHHHQPRRPSSTSLHRVSGSCSDLTTTDPTRQQEVTTTTSRDDETASDATTTGYNSEQANNDRWAVPVDHPIPDDIAATATQNDVSTPDEMAELQLSDEAVGPSSPLPLLAADGDNSLPEVDNPLYDSLTAKPTNPRLSLPESTSSPALSRPASRDVTELMSSSGAGGRFGTRCMPVDEMVEYAHVLHTQLTRLLKNLDMDDVTRKEVGSASGSSFREEGDQPPPTYEELEGL